MNRVVVTGMGMVNSLGADLPAAWRRLLRGENGIATIASYDASDYQNQVAAEVLEMPQTDQLPGPAPQEYCRRGVRLFLKAVAEAYADAGLTSDSIPGHQIGVAAGASVNYFDLELLRYYHGFRRSDIPLIDLERLARDGTPQKGSFSRRQGELMSALPARLLGLTGPNLTLDTACAAGSHAIGEAYRLVQRGRVTAMLAGGSAALVRPLVILAFSLLGALSRNPDPEQASRPFDRDRDGFVMGEGAGAVVLESLDHALARGASIYGEIVGFGSTLSGHNLTDPSPEGRAEESAMRLALTEGSLRPDSIGYIAAHGTSTPKNDAVETLAIKRLFGDHSRRLLVSSNKGQLGHTISAAGATNFIFALKALQEGVAPPTMHYRHPDPECDLDYVPNEAREIRMEAALANAFAFGGQNAVLAVRTLSQ